MIEVFFIRLNEEVNKVGMTFKLEKYYCLKVFLSRTKRSKRVIYDIMEKEQRRKTVPIPELLEAELR